MDGHTGRVGSLAWNMYVVSSGARDGGVVHHDVRQREHAVATLAAHTQEVKKNRYCSSDVCLLALPLVIFLRISYRCSIFYVNINVEILNMQHVSQLWLVQKHDCLKADKF